MYADMELRKIFFIIVNVTICIVDAISLKQNLCPPTSTFYFFLIAIIINSNVFRNQNFDVLLVSYNERQVLILSLSELYIISLLCIFDGSCNV